jgi:hypothetical protein
VRCIVDVLPKISEFTNVPPPSKCEDVEHNCSNALAKGFRRNPESYFFMTESTVVKQTKTIFDFQRMRASQKIIRNPILIGDKFDREMIEIE